VQAWQRENSGMQFCLGMKKRSWDIPAPLYCLRNGFIGSTNKPPLKRLLFIFFGEEAGNFGSTGGAGSLCHPAAIRSCFDLAIGDSLLFTTFYTIAFKFHVSSPFLYAQM
jgi:hypothetical protein